MNKGIFRTVPGILAVAFLAPLFVSGTAQAIPAFTRANNVECSTCHTIFPELNEYGEAFLKNGYVYFGKGKKKIAEKHKAAPVVVEAKPIAASPGASEIKGDGNAELLNKLKAGVMISPDTPAQAPAPAQAQPADTDSKDTSVSGGETKMEGILLAGIPEQLPVSFVVTLNGSYNKDAANEFDFATRALKLAGGGNLKDKFGFFGTFLMYAENTTGSTNTSQIPTNMAGKNDIGELFVIWRHALDTPVNIKVGRFQPKLSLWKSSNKTSLINSYDTTAYTVGVSSFKAEQSQDAVEANMIIANRLFVAAGAVNRKDQNTKEWYAHTSVKFGGIDYLTNEPEIDLNKEESVLDYLTLTIGGYGYFGKNGDPNTTVGVTPRQNEYYRAGCDADLLYKLFRLKLSGVLGNDDNPDLTYQLPAQKSYVGAVEAQYTILQNLISSLRYEYQDDGTNKVRRIIPTVAYSPIQNVKVAAEYKHENIKPDAGGDITNQIGTIGLSFGF
jgi:hypothetical protein